MPKGKVPFTATELSNDVAGLGGSVFSSQASDTTTPTATVTLRVPVAGFDQLVKESEQLGDATSVNISSQDVTAKSADYNSQIQAAQAALGQYEFILSKAQSIGDVLAVQQQITPLQSTIQQLQGQENVLENQAAYSTLTETVVEKSGAAATPRPAPRRGLSKAWAHTRHTFIGGMEAVVAALGGLAVFLLCAGAVIAIIWLGWRVLRRLLV